MPQITQIYALKEKAKILGIFKDSIYFRHISQCSHNPKVDVIWKCFQNHNNPKKLK